MVDTVLVLYATVWVSVMYMQYSAMKYSTTRHISTTQHVIYLASCTAGSHCWLVRASSSPIRSDHQEEPADESRAERRIAAGGRGAGGGAFRLLTPPCAAMLPRRARCAGVPLTVDLPATTELWWLSAYYVVLHLAMNLHSTPQAAITGGGHETV